MLHGVQELYCTHASPDSSRYFKFKEGNKLFSVYSEKVNQAGAILLVYLPSPSYWLNLPLNRSAGTTPWWISLSNFKNVKTKNYILHYHSTFFLQGVSQSLHYQTFFVKFAFSLEIDVWRIVNLSFDELTIRFYYTLWQQEDANSILAQFTLIKTFSLKIFKFKPKNLTEPLFTTTHLLPC